MSQQPPPRSPQEQRAGDKPTEGPSGSRPGAHAGVGSESVLRELRAREQRRAAESVEDRDKPD